MPKEKKIDQIIPILQQLILTLSETDTHPAVVRKVYHSLAQLHEQLEDFDMALYYYKTHAYLDEALYQNISPQITESTAVGTLDEEKTAELIADPTIIDDISLSAIVEIQEHEQKKIAKVIFDDVAQILSSVKMQLSSFLTTPPDNNENLSIQQLLVLLNNVFQEIRSITEGLSPLELENLGLESVLEELCRHSSKGNLTINFYTNIKQLHLPQWLELSIYRIAHQLIKNITLHAQASKASVQLIARDNFLFLTVEDNGKGFDIKEEMLKETNRGLRNTLIRVKILNGRINIDSSPDQGTCITIEIPYFPRNTEYVIKPDRF